MSEPFVGQIQAFGFNFPPRGWAECNGQLLSIAQNSALFSLLGTIYGGDGRTDFALPDLRGRSMVHQGQGDGLSNIIMGQKGGLESVSEGDMPSHTHTATLYGESESATTANPKNKMLATPPTTAIYAKPNSKPDDNKKMASESIVIQSSGGGGPFMSIRNPYLGVNICIATVGIFPPRD